MEITPEQLHIINQERDGKNYFDTVAATEVHGSSAKQPLNQSSFIRRFEFGHLLYAALNLVVPMVIGMEATWSCKQRTASTVLKYYTHSLIIFSSLTTVVGMRRNVQMVST